MVGWPDDVVQSIEGIIEWSDDVVQSIGVDKCRLICMDNLLMTMA